MAHKMNYAEMAKKQEEVVHEVKDLLILKFKNGIVHYSINKSAELLEQQRIEEEKNLANSLEVRMGKAVNDIENRRRKYRRNDVQQYGYDHYTKEFYYECPESSDEEDNLLVVS